MCVCVCVYVALDPNAFIWQLTITELCPISNQANLSAALWPHQRPQAAALFGHNQTGNNAHTSTSAKLHTHRRGTCSCCYCSCGRKREFIAVKVNCPAGTKQEPGLPLQRPNDFLDFVVHLLHVPAIKFILVFVSATLANIHLYWYSTNIQLKCVPNQLIWTKCRARHIKTKNPYIYI